VGVDVREMDIKRVIKRAIINLFSMRRHILVSRDTLNGLFEMERKTLVTLALLETIILYILLPLLGNAILFWYGLILTLTMWRLYNAYNYQSRPHLNSDIVWHQKFVVQVWLTALIFSLLSLFAMPMLNDYYQLFIFVVLVGISSGTVRSLSEDHRTAMGYLLIIMLPLAIEMLLLMRQDTWILTFLLVLYLFTQVGLILSAYEQSKELKRQREKIKRAETLLFEKRGILDRFFEQSEDGLFTYDRDMRVLDCNNSFTSIFHLKKEDTVGKMLYQLGDEQLVNMIRTSMMDGLKRSSGAYINQQNEELWLEIRCSPIYGRDGKSSGGIGIVTDKTKEHMMMEEMEFLISHDPLTNALNRRGFKQFINNMLRKPEHSNHYSLLFYLDLDKFKYANDIFGHDAGDSILKDVVKRLKESSEQIVGITRFGGDEFAFIVPMVATGQNELYIKIENWIKKIEDTILKPYYFQGQEMEVGCSIGLVVVEPGETNIDEVIRNADLAMLQAKGSKNRVSRFTPNMGEKYRSMYKMEQELKNAIEKDEFLVYFQPILSLSNDTVVGAEAMVRWNHPVRGVFTPQEFMPLASRFGFISKIDELMIKKVIKHIAKWREEEVFNINYISVNIDTKLILRKNFVDFIMNNIKHHNISSSQIKLEITENSLVNSFDDTSRVIEDLYIQGVECAIDDFGTGYSSLSYLKRLPFIILKIDREFVHDLTVKIENVLLIQTIIDMAHKLKFKIVIEGIEVQRQKQIIKKIDQSVEYQGYLESKPLNEEEFKKKYLLRA
jgi:diguanylate cyclase (GGDEF)-like protein/PAS domain S-box-containing protein